MRRHALWPLFAVRCSFDAVSAQDSCSGSASSRSGGPLRGIRRQDLGRGRENGGERLWRQSARTPYRNPLGDHQNKPDVASALARRWFEVDGARRSMYDELVVAFRRDALPRNAAASHGDRPGDHAAHRRRLLADRFIGVRYVSQAAGMARAVLAAGGKDWYLLPTADYAFGHQMSSNHTHHQRRKGGNVVGEARDPLNRRLLSFRSSAKLEGAGCRSCQCGS